MDRGRLGRRHRRTDHGTAAENGRQEYRDQWYFGLDMSADPASMLYGNIGGPQDLDAMSALCWQTSHRCADALLSEVITIMKGESSAIRASLLLVWLVLTAGAAVAGPAVPPAAVAAACRHDRERLDGGPAAERGRRDGIEHDDRGRGRHLPPDHHALHQRHVHERRHPRRHRQPRRRRAGREGDDARTTAASRSASGSAATCGASRSRT